jgi:hypothetical protein
MSLPNSKALDAALTFLNRQLLTSDTYALMVAKCRALIVGYDKRYRDAEYVPTAIEQLYTSDLWNPETERKSRTFTVAGKVDVLATYNGPEHHGQNVLIDHKTTSQDITDPDAPFWRQLGIEGQVSHYMLLLWLNGLKCDGAVWDVIRKPSISPKKLTKSEVKAVAATREYYGVPVSEDTIMALQITGVEDRETLGMYTARLIRDCTVERPQWYFQRRSVPRLDSEILEYAKELWEHGLDIQATNKANRHVRNSGACMLWGSACRFLGICSGYDRPNSDKWLTIPRVLCHELPELNGNGRNVLTNSRIRCYQTCKRKHYYTYILGIERLDEEEREALQFGSLIHQTLDVWWSTFLPEAHNGNSNTDPKSGGSIDSPANVTKQQQSAVVERCDSWF